MLSSPGWKVGKVMGEMSVGILWGGRGVREETSGRIVRFFRGGEVCSGPGEFLGRGFSRGCPWECSHCSGRQCRGSVLESFRISVPDYKSLLVG